MSKDKVQIFDTTLRDGEQAAGTRLGAREKLEIARQLVRLNVDIIEAGFPASSPEDFEAVRLIAENIEGPVICGLTRARKEDIDVARKALAKAKRARIHTGIGVSEVHIVGKFADEKYGKTIGEKQATILKMGAEAVKHAAQYVGEIEFYAEDSGRADRACAIRVCAVVHIRSRRMAPQSLPSRRAAQRSHRQVVKKASSITISVKNRASFVISSERRATVSSPA